MTTVDLNKQNEIQMSLDLPTLKIRIFVIV